MSHKQKVLLYLTSARDIIILSLMKQVYSPQLSIPHFVDLDLSESHLAQLLEEMPSSTS